VSRAPDISFCMIVRNGAVTLSDCLKSVTPVVDEMIVVDTGSTDDSPAIARSFGARVLSARWEGDFAAARNEYLKVARCSWVLSLDSDEMLGTVDRHALREMLTAHPRSAFVFTIRNYFFMNDAVWPTAPSAFAGEVLPGVGCTTSRTVRLLPRRRRLRYCYPVHESLIPALRRLDILLRPCAIPIHHMGYLYGRTELGTKAQSYKELGLKKVAQYPGYFLGHLELGTIFLRDGELDQAAKLFSQCLRLNPRCSKALYFLALTQFRRGRYAQSRHLLQRSLRIFPNHSDLLYLCSMVELELGNQTDAVLYLARALRRLPNQDAARSAFLRSGASSGSSGGPGRENVQAAL